MSATLGVSVATAGQSITAYAFATALLAPALLLLTGRLRRKTALLVALSLFALGNTVVALADHMA